MMSNNTQEFSSYYCIQRSDIIPYVPTDAKCVLTVGCASGITEAELIPRGVEVVGIERNPHAAAIARRRGLKILEGDADKIQHELDSWRFDCLIYADVLEHLLYPLDVLKEHVKYLRPRGTIIVSVPNFRHWSVFTALFLRGYVEYAEEGIFDRTHLRLTTRKTTLAWFAHCGIKPTLCKYHIARRRDQMASKFFLGFADEFIATQILLIGVKYAD